jgi:hypothetical protein
MPTKKEVPQMKADSKSDFSTAVIDKDAKAIIEAKKATDERINNFSSAHNSLSLNATALEERLEIRYTIIGEIESAIEEKSQLLKSSGKLSANGMRITLNGFKKTKLRNEVRNLKKTRDVVKGECRKLEKDLTSSYRKDSSRIDRSKVRNNAKKDSYHNRHGEAIQKAIQGTANGFSSEKLSSLKVDVAKADQQKGDAILMQALLKAPRHLQTRVVANEEARKGYLEYFRQLLKSGKQK